MSVVVIQFSCVIPCHVSFDIRISAKNFLTFVIKQVKNHDVVKYFQLTAAVRGFHYYRKSWLPEPEQTLNCFHEEGNTFDRFTIKVCEKDKNEIVGHLPMEISRVTKFLLDREANVSAKLTSTHYRRSPLFQGGIEIPCVVTVSMPGTVINQLLMERYKQLVETLYVEPKKEEFCGHSCS